MILYSTERVTKVAVERAPREDDAPPLQQASDAEEEAEDEQVREDPTDPSPSAQLFKYQAERIPSHLALQIAGTNYESMT